MRRFLSVASIAIALLLPASLWTVSAATTGGPALTALSPVHAWVGENSGDQGARFDLRAEFLHNGSVVATARPAV